MFRAGCARDDRNSNRGGLLGCCSPPAESDGGNSSSPHSGFGLRDLIDLHDPDLLHFDNGGFPLGWAGMNVAAYFYNYNLKTRGGKMEGVLNVKNVPDEHAKAVVADYERGVTNRIMPYVWRSETCLGDWHCSRARFIHHYYMKPAEAIHWMVDAVSKNGTFILNIPGKPDGAIDADEKVIVDAIGGWMRINGEAIYATRPWNIFGEGAHESKDGAFRGAGQLDARDIRFARNKRGDVVYAIMRRPKNGPLFPYLIALPNSRQAVVAGREIQKQAGDQASETRENHRPGAEPRAPQLL